MPGSRGQEQEMHSLVAGKPIACEKLYSCNEAFLGGCGLFCESQGLDHLVIFLKLFDKYIGHMLKF